MLHAVNSAVKSSLLSNFNQDIIDRAVGGKLTTTRKYAFSECSVYTVVA